MRVYLIYRYARARTVILLVGVVVLLALASAGAQEVAPAEAAQTISQDEIRQFFRELGSEDSSLRIEAHQKLIALRGLAAKVLAEFLGSSSENTEARRTAANLLGGCGDKAAVAVPALVAAMLDRALDIEIRRAAVHASGAIGPEARDE